MDCCHFCNPRKGCIIGGVWLLIYYSCLAYMMHYEIEKANNIELNLSQDLVHFRKVTTGFWVLGISYLVMDFLAVLLIFGAIMRRLPLLIIFTLGQIVPISVELYYLLAAFLNDIEHEAVVIYLIPLFILVYIDTVAYSCWEDLRKKKKRASFTVITIEY